MATGRVGVGRWQPSTRSWRSLPAPQVIFITEYVSSGSLTQFLKKTKKNHKAMNARVWGVGQGCAGEVGEGQLRGPKRAGARAGMRGEGAGWAPKAQLPLPHRSDRVHPPPGLEALVHTDPVGAQVRVWAHPATRLRPPVTPDLTARALLSPCSFLHACNPPIIHGNLTSDTIFIQHNGLIKIGSGAGGAGGGAAGGGGGCRKPWAEDTRRPTTLTPALSPCGGGCSVAPHLLQWCVGALGGWRAWRGQPAHLRLSPQRSQMISGALSVWSVRNHGTCTSSHQSTAVSPESRRPGRAPRTPRVPHPA